MLMNSQIGKLINFIGNLKTFLSQMKMVNNMSKHMRYSKINSKMKFIAINIYIKMKKNFK